MISKFNDPFGKIIRFWCQNTISVFCYNNKSVFIIKKECFITERQHCNKIFKTFGKTTENIFCQNIMPAFTNTISNTFKTFFMPETADQFDFSQYDYVVDAIDTVTGKLEIIERAKAAGVPVISSMGAGNKIDPTAFEVTDIYKTSVCPLAKVMRYQLKRRGIKKLKVVYSKEQPIAPSQSAYEDCVNESEKSASRRSTPGSNAFVPSVVGLIIAGEVIKDIIAAEQAAAHSTIRS